MAIETVVLVLVVVNVVGTARVMVCIAHLGKTSKVTALVPIMAMTRSRKAAKAPTLILSSRKTSHLTYRA